MGLFDNLMNRKSYEQQMYEFKLAQKAQEDAEVAQDRFTANEAMAPHFEAMLAQQSPEQGTYTSAIQELMRHGGTSDQGISSLGDLMKQRSGLRTGMAKRSDELLRPKPTARQTNLGIKGPKGRYLGYAEMDTDQRALSDKYDETKASRTTIDMGKGPSKFYEHYGKTQAASFTEQGDKIESLQQSLPTVYGLYDMVANENNPMYTGMTANIELGLNKMLQSLGFNPDSEDAIANTEKYFTQMGRETAQIIKDFGAGTGLSDADRVYATNIGGGNIKLDRNSLKKILKMNIDYTKRGFDQYNKKAKQVDSAAEAAGQKLPYSAVRDFPTGRISHPANKDYFRLPGSPKWYKRNK